mgnify:CR=1 FL=1
MSQIPKKLTSLFNSDDLIDFKNIIRVNDRSNELVDLLLRFLDTHGEEATKEKVLTELITPYRFEYRRVALDDALSKLPKGKSMMVTDSDPDTGEDCTYTVGCTDTLGYEVYATGVDGGVMSDAIEKIIEVCVATGKTVEDIFAEINEESPDLLPGETATCTRTELTRGHAKKYLFGVSVKYKPKELKDLVTIKFPPLVGDLQPTVH